MSIKAVFTGKAPGVVGPYSQAISYGDFVFCSGQIGIDPRTNNVVEGIDNQTKQVMQNLFALLQEAGSDLNHVLKTTIYLSDMNNYAKVNEIYGQYFKQTKPARATIQVSRLPKDCLIEIDMIAVLG